MSLFFFKRFSKVIIPDYRENDLSGDLSHNLKRIDEKKLHYIGVLSDFKKKKIKAEVFLGGSLAKNTLVKKDKYDIDIFVRFDKTYRDEQISSLLNKIVPNAKRIHGSRDYFQINKQGIFFEIVPVIKIAKPEQARNVTDLSYFHVKYLKENLGMTYREIGELLNMMKEQFGLPIIRLFKNKKSL